MFSRSSHRHNAIEIMNKHHLLLVHRSSLMIHPGIGSDATVPPSNSIIVIASYTIIRPDEHTTTAITISRGKTIWDRPRKQGARGTSLEQEPSSKMKRDDLLARWISRAPPTTVLYIVFKPTTIQNRDYSSFLKYFQS